MLIETAGMLRACQIVAESGSPESQGKAQSVASYMMHQIMNRFVDLPPELEGWAREVLELAKGGAKHGSG